MGRLLKRVLTWLSWVAAGIVALAAAFVVCGRFSGWEFDAVLSGSMEPVFHVGGLVVIKPADASAVKVGDVISFKYPDMDTPICHRVIALEESAVGPVFVTKGDANDAADKLPVTAQMIQGKAVMHLTYVGKLANLAQIARQRVTILGRSLPYGGVLFIAMGVLFSMITMKEIIELIQHPERERFRAVQKKRHGLIARRRKMFDEV